MTLNRAREILRGVTQPDGGLFCCGNYTSWNAGAAMITLDGRFDADDLEAMAVWMRHFTTQKGVDHEGQEAHG